MGNLAKSFGSSFIIRRSRQAECLQAVWPDAPKGGLLDRLRPPVRRLLEEAFRREGWALVFDARGDVMGVTFVGEKLSGLPLFEAAAPFVEPGSYVDFWQEYAGGEGDRPNTRWRFDGRQRTWEDLTPPEVREAQRQAEERWRNRDHQAAAATNQENVRRVERGEAPLCSECVAERRPASWMAPHDYPAPRDNPLVVMKAHKCPACGATFLPPSEQERFHAAIQAKHAASRGP